MNDDEVEKVILYYMIFENEQCDLSEKDFFNPVHKQIISALNIIKQKKEDISLIAIKNYMKSEDGNLLTYLSNLGEYIYNMSFEKAYETLKNYTKKRQVNQVGQVINETIQENDVNEVDGFIEKLIAKLQQIQSQTEKDENFSIQLSNTLNDIEKKIRQKEKDYSLFTGFFDLDALTDGLHNGELTIIGARPRSWKNNFCVTDRRIYSKKKKSCSLC